jgi:soluble lytic murein transglycosylase
VARWVEKLNNLEVDEFIEEIPYQETRNYVKRVLRSYGVYKTLYD